MEVNIWEKYGDPEHCPVRNVVDRFGDKWSVLVLLVLEDGQVLRFNEIYTCIKTISQKMLSGTLKTLEADGLVKRTVYPQIPPKVEYNSHQEGSLCFHTYTVLLVGRSKIWMEFRRQGRHANSLREN